MRLRNPNESGAGTQEGLPVWPARLVAGMGAFAAAVGAVTLVGWLAGIQWLTDWKGDGISMFPNTAVCALASGLALIVSPRRGTRDRTVVSLASLVVLIAGLTLGEHLVGVDLRIDQLLLPATSWGQAAAAAPMRMGPPASLSFLLSGTALVLSTVGRLRDASAACGLAVMAIALLSLTGHLYGAQQMYTVPRLTGIAMQTALALVTVGIGIVARVPDSRPLRTVLETPAARLLVGRTLPIVLVAALSIGWVRVRIQDAGLVDTAFGTALRTLVEIVIFTGVLWWAAARIGRQDEALRRSEVEVRRHAERLARDIAALQAAERTQALLAAIVAASEDAIVSKTLDGTITSWNAGAEHIFGYRADEAIGEKIDLILPEDRRDEEREILRRLRAGLHIEHFETVRRAKDGHLVDVSLTISPIRDSSGRIIGASKIARDVTDRKRAEAEREESNRRKDEFIAILAHELRSPLAPVRHAARYLKLQGPTDPAFARPVDIIERQVAQMARLIDDLLDASRFSRGALELRRERVDCREIVESAVDTCRDEIQAKGHRLHVDLPTRSVELDADRERLVQVLSNLLGNAAKYTPPGGTLTLHAAVTPDGILEIRMEDDGIGIPPDKLSQIFDLFVRVDDSLERQGGLGIGLTLARQLVELHCGTIEAHSEGPGRGSRFVVRIPALVAAARPAAAPADVAPCGAPLRIVVADDSHDAVESLALLLELGGHEVHTAFDGAGALDAVERLRPHVALLDIGMPIANGYEVARRIRAQPWGRGIHLVALTGWGQDADRVRASDAGFDEHLVKPVPPEALERLLGAIAGRERAIA